MHVTQTTHAPHPIQVRICVTRTSHAHAPHPTQARTDVTHTVCHAHRLSRTSHLGPHAGPSACMLVCAFASPTRLCVLLQAPTRLCALLQAHMQAFMRPQLLAHDHTRFLCTFVQAGALVHDYACTRGPHRGHSPSSSRRWGQVPSTCCERPISAAPSLQLLINIRLLKLIIPRAASWPGHSESSRLITRIAESFLS